MTTDPTSVTAHGDNTAPSPHSVLDEAEAVRLDRCLAAEFEACEVDVTPPDDRLPEQVEPVWMRSDLARQAQTRGKLDPRVATALRLVADAVGVSAAALSDAVQAALAREASP
jgi:hypothetical protein